MIEFVGLVQRSFGLRDQRKGVMEGSQVQIEMAAEAVLREGSSGESKGPPKAS